MTGSLSDDALHGSELQSTSARHHSTKTAIYLHSFPASPQLLPPPFQNHASHINHQERSRCRRSPLLLELCSPHERRCHRLGCLKANRICWRVGLLFAWRQYACRLTRDTVMLSPSARPLLRSSTSARKRRPSTSTTHCPSRSFHLALQLDESKARKEHG